MSRLLALYRDAFSGLPRQVWKISAAMLINRAGSMVLPFLALYLRSQRGLTVAEVGLFLSVYGVGSTVGGYVGGWLSDRIGALRTQQISLLGAGVAFLFIPRAESMPEMMIAVFVAAVVADAFRPAAMSSIAHRVESKLRPRAFALLRLAANVGMTIGPAVGGVLATISYEWLFICDAATCWFAASLLLFGFGWSRRGHAEENAAPARGSSPWRDLPFLALLALIFLLICCFFQLFATVPLYYRAHFGLAEHQIGMLFAINGLMIAAFEMVLVHLAQRARRFPIIAFGVFLTCSGFALMPLGTTTAWVALTVVVWTTGEMLAIPFLNAAVAERAAAGQVGRYMGAFVMPFSIAHVIAPAIGSGVFEYFGPETLWYGIGLLGIGLTFLTLLVGKMFESGGNRRSALR